MAEKKYIVEHDVVGGHSKGTILSAKEAGDSLEWWQKVGAVREATAEEAKQGDPGELGSEARSVELSKGADHVDEIEEKAARNTTGANVPPPATATDADRQNAERAKGK